MTAPDATSQAGRLSIARRRLAGKYPFHAALVAEWEVAASTDVDTMGVSVRDGRVHLLFNPTFVSTCSFPELLGVLLHEAHHVLFGHVLVDRAGYDDQEARIIAEEVTANEWISEPLPGNPILLESYPQLPPDEDTETRYQRLRRAAAAPGSGQAQETGPPEALDDHEKWGDSGATARMTVRAAVRLAAESLGPETLQALPEALLDAIEGSSGNNSGTTTSGLSEQVGADGVAAVDWRGALASLVCRDARLQPTFVRPSRRFPHLVGIVPGRQRQPEVPRVLAVIDTSGSISEATLRDVSAELTQMAAHATITVCECDTEVHSVYAFMAPLGTVTGRGGTDLRPPFAIALTRKYRPDALIYFTDGYGPAPEKPPRFPVFWCLTADGVTPAPWGRVLKMTN